VLWHFHVFFGVVWCCTTPQRICQKSDAHQWRCESINQAPCPYLAFTYGMFCAPKKNELNAFHFEFQ
jgi:hypothetical protein